VEDSLEEGVAEESSQVDSMDITELEMALKEWGGG
jgi:acyl carrier protein